MIVTLKKGTPKEELNKLIGFLNSKGVNCKYSDSINYDCLLLSGPVETIDLSSVRVFSCVANVTRITPSYKLVSREYKKTDTVIKVNDIEIGKDLLIIAGPCSIKTYDEMLEIGKQCIENGANVLRGGAYKVRTSPYAYAGLGVEGLKILHRVGEELGIPVVSEIASANDICEFEKYVDIIQVGAKNMMNVELLNRLGKTNKPVLLKRGMMATIEEVLLSAEYILKAGNPNVILCERGIKSFDKETRNVLDLGGALVVKKYSHLPVIVDPSHASGRSDLVCSLGLASIASGLDGVIIEVHNNPETSASDAMQAVTPKTLGEFVQKAKEIRKIIGK